MRLLERDFNRARRLRNRIDQTNNCEVVNSESVYFNPQTTSLVLPLRHQDGVFMYYQNLMDTLEEALVSGKILLNAVPRGSPRYILDLGGNGMFL